MGKEKTKKQKTTEWANVKPFVKPFKSLDPGDP